MQASKIIPLNSGAKSILKIGFILRASFILFFCLAAGLGGIHNFKEYPVLSLFLLSACFILFLIFYKLLSAAFFRENLLLSNDTITIQRKKIGNTDEQHILLKDITYFGYAQQDYTPHPFDNTIIDFTGLATQEKELQYVIDEGKIQISTAGDNYRFGKNMASWEVEEVLDEVEAFTGMKFKRPVQMPNKNDAFFPLEEEGLLPDADQSEVPESSSVEEPTSKAETTNYEYQIAEGTLVIAQKESIPSSEDWAYLNGKVAPTGKYYITEKNYIMVSNGLIYAVRGFKKE